MINKNNEGKLKDQQRSQTQIKNRNIINNKAKPREIKNKEGSRRQLEIQETKARIEPTNPDLPNTNPSAGTKSRRRGWRRLQVKVPGKEFVQKFSFLIRQRFRFPLFLFHFLFFFFLICVEQELEYQILNLLQ